SSNMASLERILDLMGLKSQEEVGSGSNISPLLKGAKAHPVSFCATRMYLSRILGANFSSESGPEILLLVSLIIKFRGHVTTKKGATWLFDNEKGSHL